MDIVEFCNSAPENHEIWTSFAKLQQHLEACKAAAVGISGGRDSDTLFDIVSRADRDEKAIYFFLNTGIEYEATKKHIEYLQIRYGIEIKEYKAKEPVPIACRKYGVPFISKQVSEMIYRLQRHNFKWEDKPFDELYAEYPKCKIALRWWCNEGGEGSRFNIERNKYLKEFLMQHPPTFQISQKCCDCAKKKPLKEAIKYFDCDLQINGVRQAENGLRSVVHKSCFTNATAGSVASFRPLYWLTDNDRAEYEEAFSVKHSDCYEVYGLKRTGCAGCPFGSKFEEELEIIQKYEPKLYNAVNKIFGASYEYMRQYREFKERMKGGAE